MRQLSSIIKRNLFELDRRLSEICKSNSVTYSRYADDLYFSTNMPNVLENILNALKQEIITIRHPKLLINHEKTVFTSRKRLRKITGITITSTNRLSIGRKRKRLIKSMVYEYINGTLSPNKVSYLKGIIAYIRSIEPSFIDTLEKKYGREVILEIRGVKHNTRKS